MIYLRKGQILKDNPGMVVYDPTGYYNDGDSVICSSVISPDEPACRFEAKYIAYGGLVYSVTNADELLEQIIKMDPNSLFGKDSKQIAVDQMVEKIVPQKSTDLTEETASETPATTTPETNNTQPVATTTPSTIPSTSPDANTSTTTPPIMPIIDTSTTTPPFIAPIDTSTTTPDFISEIGTSTTTPTILPPIDLSTTTPDIAPEVNTSTTTQSILPDTGTSTTTINIIEPVIETQTPQVQENTTPSTSTTSEVVAFAKKLVKNKISKELGL